MMVHIAMPATTTTNYGIVDEIISCWRDCNVTASPRNTIDKRYRNKNIQMYFPRELIKSLSSGRDAERSKRVGELLAAMAPLSTLSVWYLNTYV